MVLTYLHFRILEISHGIYDEMVQNPAVAGISVWVLYGYVPKIGISILIDGY